ncbi:trimeric intracellular cation channel family protein [Rhodococcus sp. BP-252]|uniref:trimeric intracellular cation channel family protein n=1 Tax=unclassified Rhodococcus (in: high G+C Gram-positive bacteria) TaxID=192944 RepID=UPI000DF369F4|nr:MULTISPECIES: trimeric intracellular cation channel family protein [unclassified Rhodococcus (in: high G+C Gram-positive bacteria)]MBY6414571.1 trimeric intracellular cation channel family protein [Rhodococcus sp. BP-320]MBY6419328.1 trimeric intracellular cation channel family protein [Rhodococcus sp. BP-321]MBY6424310.1 trimeric intracellular cation channel family protein [Rhodococcus sp. BP-324]MBY6429407.1 trimeric intracellular cation channel family protein [Rhodococcus sp. BP-323]MBY6
MLVDVLGYVGIAAFAASGALIGVRKRLDLFGVCVVGITTGIGGGIIRDLLLGIHPPTSLDQWPNIAVALASSLLVFVAHPAMSRVRRGVLIFDAFGMGLFASTGATIALDTGGSSLAACLIGATTAVAGGVIRDVLVNEVPLLLRRDLYAVPALLGSTTVAAVVGFGWPVNIGLIAGTVIATGLRLLALWRRWNLPIARRLPAED